MTDRKYTVSEIDALRECCRHKWIWGAYFYTPVSKSGGRTSRPYQQQDLDRGVEEMVRTFMIAGITIEDIRAEFYETEHATYVESLKRAFPERYKG